MNVQNDYTSRVFFFFLYTTDINEYRNDWDVSRPLLVGS